MEILGYITGNPTYTTSHWATELCAGLCPPLCASIADWGSASTTAVVSEYAVRDTIAEIELENGVTGINLGGHNISAGIVGIFDEFIENNVFYPGADTGDYCIRDPRYWRNNWRDLRFTATSLTADDIRPHTIKYRSLDVHPDHTQRIKLNYINGLNGVGSALQIFYDGRPSEDVYLDSKDGSTVQGGRYQMMTQVPGEAWLAESEGRNINTEYSEYTVSGYCNSTYTLPIKANSKNCLGWKYADMAIAKIGIRIPYGKGFPVSDQEIWLGVPEEPRRFGYFLTKTNDEVFKRGEWQTFIYAGSLSANQYDYFTSPSKIYAWTPELTLAKGPGNRDLAINESDTEVGDWFGEFDIRVFYDKVTFNTSTGPIYGYGIGTRYQQYTSVEKIKDERRDLLNQEYPVPTDRLSYITDTYEAYASVTATGSKKGWYGGGCIESNYFCQLAIDTDDGVVGYSTSWANETWQATDIFPMSMTANKGQCACDQNDTQGIDPTYGIFAGKWGGIVKYTFSSQLAEDLPTSVAWQSNGFENAPGMGNDKVSFFASVDKGTNQMTKFVWSTNMSEANPPTVTVYEPEYSSFTDYEDKESDLVQQGFKEPKYLGNVTWTDIKDYGYILGSGKDQQIIQYAFATETADFIWGTPPKSNWFAARKESSGTYSWSKGYLMSTVSRNNINEQSYIKFDYASATVEEVIREKVRTRANQCTTQSK